MFFNKLSLWMTCAIQSLTFFISCQIGLQRNSQKKWVQKYFVQQIWEHFGVGVPWTPLLIFYQCSARHCRINNYSQIPRAIPKKGKRRGSPAYATMTTCHQFAFSLATSSKVGFPWKNWRFRNRIKKNKQQMWNGNLYYFVSSFLSCLILQ